MNVLVLRKEKAEGSMYGFNSKEVCQMTKIFEEKMMSYSGNKPLDLLREGVSDDDVIHINKKGHNELFFTMDEE